MRRPPGNGLDHEDVRVGADPEGQLLRRRNLREPRLERREVRRRAERGGLPAPQERLAAAAEGRGKECFGVFFFYVHVFLKEIKRSIRKRNLPTTHKRRPTSTCAARYCSDFRTAVTSYLYTSMHTVRPVFKKNTKIDILRVIYMYPTTYLHLARIFFFFLQ